MAKFKRRRYFIDKQLQTKYIALSVIMLLVYTMLFVAILLSPYIIALTFDAPIAEQTEAAKTLLILDASIWPALGIVIFIMSSLSIFITHKIAGPVYRFKKVLAEISCGNLDVSIKLRDKDDLKDLAEEFNLVIGDLRGLVATLRDDDQTLSSCINELEEKIQADQISREDGKALIEKMQASKVGLEKALSKYAK